VDIITRTLTVQPFEGDPVTLRFTFDTESEKNGASDTPINALIAGDVVVSASYRSDSGEVIKMVVLSPDILTTRGYIKDIDSTAREIVVAAIDRDIVLEIKDVTKIIKDGEPVPFARLSQRDIIVEAYYVPDGPAIRIKVRSPNTVVATALSVMAMAQGR
jgi:hypothetical protein